LLKIRKVILIIIKLGKIREGKSKSKSENESESKKKKKIKGEKT
jgi:hypothetical protein